MKKSLGIIGCGSVVQTMYIYSIPGWQHISKIYVYDTDTLQAEKVAEALQATISGFENLVQKCDIIIIASPPHTHYSLLKECLQKDKTVICEKPFLLDAAEAQEIVQLADTAGAQLFVAHMRRVLPAALLAKKILSSGVLGNISEIHLFEGARFSYQTQSGYETGNAYGGVLADTGSHILDMALFVTGLDEKNIVVEEIVVNRDKPEPAHAVESSFRILTEGSSVLFKLKLSRKQTLANKINFYCENGVLELPAGLQNAVRIHKPGNKPFVAYSPNQMHNYHHALAAEYDTIFDSQRNFIFKAERFINLAEILGKLYLH